jgi:hypothetical protein
VYNIAQAGQSENVILLLVWNGDIGINRSLNVRMEIPSPFVQNTYHPNPIVFYPPECRERSTIIVLKYVFLSIFIIFQLRKIFS